MDGKDQLVLWAWGSNGNGSLGIGNEEDSSLPVISKLSSFLQSQDSENDSQKLLLVGGGSHVIAVSHSKVAGERIFSWGWGENGQLGIPNTEKKLHSPSSLSFTAASKVISISAGWTFSVICTGDVYFCGDSLFGNHSSSSEPKDILTPIPVSFPLSPSLKITQVSGGLKHCLALAGRVICHP
eukprot:TRINITY_DN367_c0_g1_i1.p1 TRINITY_DN367_c0_g1~~TRINITY_DN367_c0_g1_i1.p1  ORF type:complete len:198 (-),score=41.16 TRINITY_DN367_c0_g1_i1:1683-2231(-)